MSDLNKIRREQTKKVMLENAIGSEELAYCVGKEPEEVEKLLSSSSGRFSDQLARQIEQTFSKPKYWLDLGLTDSDDTPNNFDLFG